MRLFTKVHAAKLNRPRSEVKNRQTENHLSPLKEQFQLRDGARNQISIGLAKRCKETGRVDTAKAKKMRDGGWHQKGEQKG